MKTNYIRREHKMLNIIVGVGLIILGVSLFKYLKEEDYGRITVFETSEE